MNQHGSRGSIGKPPPVKHLLRLTGSQKTPSAIHPGLHPGMIVITVSPSRRIHLPCRNPHTAQRRYQKDRLFPAPPASAYNHCLRTDRPPVGGSIGSLAGTPVIDPFYSLLQRIIPNHGLQHFIEPAPAVCQGLTVHPVAEHIVQKHFLGKLSGPQIFFPEKKSMLHIIVK